MGGRTRVPEMWMALPVKFLKVTGQGDPAGIGLLEFNMPPFLSVFPHLPKPPNHPSPTSEFLPPARSKNDVLSCSTHDKVHSVIFILYAYLITRSMFVKFTNLLLAFHIGSRRLPSTVNANGADSETRKQLLKYLSITVKTSTETVVTEILYEGGDCTTVPCSWHPYQLLQHVVQFFQGTEVTGALKFCNAIPIYIYSTQTWCGLNVRCQKPWLNKLSALESRTFTHQMKKKRKNNNSYSMFSRV